MGKAFSITMREVSMLAIGNRIKCMGTGYFTIQIIKLPMKESGKMISFQGMAPYITKKSSS